jgi:glutathione-regulated potassium-efflux system ancillary protein KefF
MICVIHAHPYPRRSHANRVLAQALGALPDVDLRELYERYPDFDIDVAAEQQALQAADLVVWMHPVFWYSVPGMLKHWFDKVLTYGWAFGEGGRARAGQRCLWVPTTGGDDADYAPGGMHAHPLAHYAAPIEQTALFCGMRWEAPHVITAAAALDERALAAHAQALAQRFAEIRATAGASTSTSAPAAGAAT